MTGRKAVLRLVLALALEVAVKPVTSLSSPCLSYSAKKG